MWIHYFDQIHKIIQNGQRKEACKVSHVANVMQAVAKCNQKWHLTTAVWCCQTSQMKCLFQRAVTIWICSIKMLTFLLMLLLLQKLKIFHLRHCNRGMCRLFNFKILSNLGTLLFVLFLPQKIWLQGWPVLSMATPAWLTVRLFN